METFVVRQGRHVNPVSLNYQIGRQKGIHLHTLEDVMEKAKDMEIQERKKYQVV